MTLWTALATCGTCGLELGKAEHVPEHRKTIVAMSAPLNCICPVKEHNSYSDCNIGVAIGWVEEVGDERV